jgi:hypothetical protein
MATSTANKIRTVQDFGDFNPLAFPYTHENGSAYTTNCKVDYTAQGSDESIRTAWTCENCTRFPTTQCRLHYTA